MRQTRDTLEVRRTSIVMAWPRSVWVPEPGGSIDPAPLITRTVSLDAPPGAMLELNDPQDCKVLVDFSPSA